MARVAAAWTMIAGWYRTDGQATPVVRPIQSVFIAIAASRFPGEGAVTLSFHPRVIVVAHLDEVEAGLFGQETWRMSSFGPKVSVASL
jgi:hypothetical protein